MDSPMDAIEFFNDQTTILSPIIEPATTTTTTTESPLTTIIFDMVRIPLSTTEAAIAAATTKTTTIVSNMLNQLNPYQHPYPYQREHLEHNKITFEIPNHHDLEHIDSIHNFNTLLKRIGNAVTTIDASQFYAGNNQQNHYQHNQQHEQQQQQHLPQEQLLTNAEIAKSVVLDLADLRGNDEAIGLERFFGGADMHSIVNYLWIGVVTSLIILSIIFIVFSCYFYRKFREWKKCNKHMREHLNSNIHRNNNDNNPMLYANSIGMVNTSAFFTQMPEGNKMTSCYEAESPPCYTIATGLPSYDEALLHNHKGHHQLHHQQQQQQHQKQNKNQKQRNYFNYAFKCMYSSTPTAIQQQPNQYQHYQLETKEQQQQQQQQQHHHHHHHHSEDEEEDAQIQHMDVIQQNISISDEHLISKWRKVNSNIISTTTTDSVDNKMQQYCCNTDSFNIDDKNSSNKEQQRKQQNINVSTLLLQQSQSQQMQPTYDISPNDIELATSMLLPIENVDNKIHICISDEKLMNRKEVFVEGIQQTYNIESTETACISGDSTQTHEWHNTIEAATHVDPEGFNAIVVV